MTTNESLNAHKPGDKVRFLLSRRSSIREIEVILGKKIERSFRIQALPSSNTPQAEILQDWLKK